MPLLYTKMAHLYHEIYKKIFDYRKEYEFYNQLLSKNKCQSLLEIGCGSGSLAQHFIKNGYNYLGIDISDEMLGIARKENEGDYFILQDMRQLNYSEKFDSVIMSGNSISHIINNIDIKRTLTGINKALKGPGLLAFGFFDANSIFTDFKPYSQTIEVSGKLVKRKSRFREDLSTGWTYEWQTEYTIEENGTTSYFKDNMTLRAFTRDEIELFLVITGFNMLAMEREGKAFNIVAQKK